MRVGAHCAAPQTLSAEAASALKHSLSLARRRGHAQVTPLHVAATLLTTSSSPNSTTSLLRRACLKSQPPPHHLHHHHPLQCRALELCFNVALNRLPASPHFLHAPPSLSNALVAALKRAQAHHRKGCVEQQSHPFVAVKIELEQLVLSIMDDPSVSRVMREAGFSSTSVKNNLVDDDCTNKNHSASSSSVFHCYNSPPTKTHEIRSFLHSHLLPYPSTQNQNQNPLLFSPQKSCSLMNEDMNAVYEVLMGKNRSRNCVIVGDSTSMAESLVAELIDKMEKGDVPDELKSAHVIKFQFSSLLLRFMNREEVDMHVADLRKKVESFAASSSSSSSSSSSGGRVIIIIYIGDLKWTAERDNNGDVGEESVDRLIAEIGKLLSWFNNNSSNVKVSLMATANYQSYINYQMKKPPLDIQWDLQTVSVPSGGGLGLSLNTTSDRDARITLSQNPSSQAKDKNISCLQEKQDHVLTCCPECKSNYEKEAGFSSILQKSLSPHCNNYTLFDKEDHLVQLRRKYNKMCHNFHQRSIFADSAFPPNQSSGFYPRSRREQSSHIEFSFDNWNPKYQSSEPNLDEEKISLTLGNSMHTYHAPKPENTTSVIQMKLVVNESTPYLGLKRKADHWDSRITCKNSRRRSIEMEEVSSLCGKRESARQSSSNSLDLNVKAEEEEDDDRGEKTGDFSPVSSDLTRETITEPNNNSPRLLEKLLSKLKTSFEEAFRGKNASSSFHVEEMVLEKIVKGCGSYVNNLFDEWLKDVFQVSLLGMGVVSVRLCLGGKDEITCAEDGFMGTCLPKRIPVSFLG